ncbi:MAG: AmmeMemoRadiSam system radical SAM enzyme [Verrucomicrobiae bacterium]|nr:AmmeMemoRadiSam system radical SAM enzyme [Verrucomicrobiae bacterium]
MKKWLAGLFGFLVVALAVAQILAREKTSAGGGSHEALFWEKAEGGKVKCLLCPRLCVLPEGQFGVCRARKNVGGVLKSMVYGQVVSANVDPIEKKPFYHVLPGTKAFSIATTGCNLRCLFCQNWQISQVFPHDLSSTPMTPDAVVGAAVKSGSRSIAFTYNEPVIFYEYMLDVAQLARKQGLKTVVVSSGYINPEPLRKLLKHIDAFKVDFKGYDEEFYLQVVGGTLDPVLESMKVIRQEGVWLEVVNLMVPGKNDSEKQIRELVRWVRRNLGDETPLQFSRFYPIYKLQNLPPTPEETLLKARQMARQEGLKYVYTGNIADREGATTYAPKSGEAVIERQGYFVTANRLNKGVTPGGERIPGIWE